VGAWLDSAVETCDVTTKNQPATIDPTDCWLRLIAKEMTETTTAAAVRVQVELLRDVKGPVRFCQGLGRST
jgi:hypothetical protein